MKLRIMMKNITAHLEKGLRKKLILKSNKLHADSVVVQIAI